MGVGKGGLLSNGFVVGGHGLLVAAGGHQGVAQVRVHGRHHAVELHGLLDQCHPFVGPASLHAQHPQQVQGVDVARVRAENLAVQALGLGCKPSLVQLHGLRECGLQGSHRGGFGGLLRHVRGQGGSGAQGQEAGRADYSGPPLWCKGVRQGSRPGFFLTCLKVPRLGGPPCKAWLGFLVLNQTCIPCALVQSLHPKHF